MHLIIVVFALMLTVASCGPIGDAVQKPRQVTAQTASASEQSINEAQLESYDGPKARVAVYRFEDQSAKGGGGKSYKGWYSKEIGNGMADMLNDALVRSNRFLVLDRQSLQDVLMEQDLGATGRIRATTAPRIGVIEGADLLIKGSVTEFEPGSSGGNDSNALRYFGGAPAAIIGGVLGGVEQSHVAMVVQVVDATTSRILFSTTVEGNANDFNLSGFVGSFGKNFSTTGGLGAWQNTPMEKAIRVAIVAAVQEISDKTPKTYYRYGDFPSTNSAPTETPLQSEPTAATDVTFTAVKVKSANLRDAPGVQGKVIATLKAGTNLLINAEDKDWYFVQTEDGKSSGWIAKSLTK